MRRLVLVLFLFGCGSNDSSTTTPPVDAGPKVGDGTPTPRAQQDCVAFMQMVCGKFIGCDPSIVMADCIASLQTTLDCAKVVTENGELARCEGQFANSTCNVLLDPNGGAPASCKGVFLTN